MSYRLLDSGNEQKLEQVGPYRIIRPAAGAIWPLSFQWKHVDARFLRKGSSGNWDNNLPKGFEVSIGSIKMFACLTEFGHLGFFPEHAMHHESLMIKAKGANVLNLFAYTGAATIACVKGGALSVCHVDASKKTVESAKENAELNQLKNASIRWIVDDVFKFLKREIRRARRYDLIILDPPSFGRGTKGEVFKIEECIQELLLLCKELLSEKARMILLTCHTPGITPTTLENCLKSYFDVGECTSGEMFLDGPLPCPAGSYAKWEF